MSRYLQNGLQSLTKRDLDLLLYYRLEKDGIVSPAASNTEVAHLLKVTPQKVASLRRDACARWATTEEINELVRTEIRRALMEPRLASALDYGGRPGREAGWLPLVIEHPGVRAEIEGQVKRDGGIVRYERNREVIMLKYGNLLSVFFSFDLLGPEPRILETLNHHFESYTAEGLEREGIKLKSRVKLTPRQILDVGKHILDLVATNAGSDPSGFLKKILELFRALLPPQP